MVLGILGPAVELSQVWKASNDEFNKPDIMYEPFREKTTMQNLCYEIVEDLVPIAYELKILFFYSTLYFLSTNVFSHLNCAAGLQFQL